MLDVRGGCQAGSRYYCSSVTAGLPAHTCVAQNEFTQGLKALVCFLFSYFFPSNCISTNNSFHWRRSTNQSLRPRWVTSWATQCCCWSRVCFGCCRYCGLRCCSLRPAGTSGPAVCQLSLLDVEQEREWRGRQGWIGPEGDRKKIIYIYYRKAEVDRKMTNPFV